jgi:Mn-dependent DtxR family transcriptional regulator
MNKASQSRLLKYLGDPYEAQEPGMLTKEIADDLFVLPEDVNKALKRLKNLGLVEVEYHGKKPHKAWAIPGTHI